MREISGKYRFTTTHLRNLSEVDLLSHYRLAEVPSRSAIHQLRVQSMGIDQAIFSLGGAMATDHQIQVLQQEDSLTVCCSCAADVPFLCYHEMLALIALITQKNYRSFFDVDSRRSIFLPYASRYGLDKEEMLDDYFTLLYDKGTLLVEPKHENILAVDAHAADKELSAIVQTKKSRAAWQPPEKKRILLLSKHRFYQQLRMELLDVDSTQNGKPKPPFVFVDPKPLLWKTKDIAEAKLYAALSSFQQNYTEEADETTLDALHVLCEHARDFPVYYHDQRISEKISSKSMRPINLALLDASIEISVFKRQPFYEIKAALLWNDERIPLKNLQLQHQYFFCRQDHFLLIRDLATLKLLEYFRKSPEILLVHASKYDEFVRHTLQPLEHMVHINYAFARAANSEEKVVFNNDQEHIIYFSQENSYINITPVMRYGTVEVALSSKKKIRSSDENGNVYEVERAWDIEDRFRQLVVRQHPEFAGQQQEMNYFYLHHQHFLADNWFLHAFEAWRNEGITLLGFQEMGITKLSPHKAKIAIHIVSGTDWFNVKLNTSFGDQQVSIKQLHRALRHKSKYIPLDDGSIGMLPDEWMAKIARYFQFGILEADLLKVPKIGLTAVEELFEDELLPREIREEVDELEKRLSNIKKRNTVKVPSMLKAQLRPYQLDGLRWLNQLDDLNLGGCLADDMGLGKTIQLIAHLLLQQEKGQHGINLIVAPTSLLFNWQQEFEKFAPSLKVICIQGASREQHYDSLKAYDVALISYGLLLSDINKLKKQPFNTLVLDESQAIKNPSSERYKAARLLTARIRFALTGTPIENSTFDLYGQLSFACPGLLGNRQFFKDTYATPIDRFEDGKRAKDLQQRIAPFILRRTKKQVVKELPEKTEMIIYCDMGAQQRAIYDSYEAELRDYLQGTSDDELQKSSMHVLAGLTRLRQICNAPFLLKEGYDAHISAKLDALVERVQDISGDHKILIFSQFVEMLDLIKAALDDAQIPSSYLTGKTKDRAKVVSEFQTDDEKRVFLISLKAGGVGLNLTAADYVFLVDPWWNPAVENQAIDRLYRIGQEKQVFAIRLICPNTVEEKIQRLQDKKRDLAGDMIKSDIDLTRKFSKQDWLDLLQ
ncbi:DEAD/DEAH box helicase [Sphingobacterium bambusae]|uniref:DEAD/DEAH box helicase n=1 Tax=Sphingobacterium bambusae TaxID=662858 RepID=A0ABW6BH57_9SPHI|nr:DEAD/DEAH box helicase [Sphingobacterium bambusae]WPL49733.1 DEAD/DEAH box helicase [Sphingobacterium bambusae]